jgi:hypothetical protein
MAFSHDLQAWQFEYHHPRYPSTLPQLPTPSTATGAHPSPRVRSTLPSEPAATTPPQHSQPQTRPNIHSNVAFSPMHFPKKHFKTMNNMSVPTSTSGLIVLERDLSTTKGGPRKARMLLNGSIISRWTSSLISHTANHLICLGRRTCAL